MQEILVRDFSEFDRPQWKGEIIKEDARVTLLKLYVISQQASRTHWVKEWNGKIWDNTENEAVALSELQEAFYPNNRLFVPRLVIWDPDRKYVVTEDYGGVTFRSMLLWNGMFSSKRSKLMARTDDIVDWLCWLQANTNTNNGFKVDVEKLDQEFSWRLSFCSEHGFLSKRMVESLNEAYKTCLAAVEDTEFKMVPVHGDFGPVNVLLGRYGVCVVDFELYHCGAPFFDVCYMFVSLWAMSVYHVFARACLGNSAERFLSKCRVKLNLDDQGLRLGILQILLEKTYFGVKGYYLGKRRASPSRLRWLARAYCYRHMLARGLKDGLF